MASAQSPIFRLLRIYHLPTAHFPIIYVLQIDKNYFTIGNRLNIPLLCTEKFYDNLKLPVWNLSTIYMATAQKNNFLATAHHKIICLLQIEQLFQKLNSSKYLLTVHWRIVWLLQIAYSETFRRFKWLLRKVQFLVYCASHIYFATAHLPIIYLLQIDQLFHHWKLSKYLITEHRKISWQLQITYL